MDFFSAPVPKNLDVKRNLDVVDNNTLYEDDDYDVVILLEKHLNKKEIKFFVNEIKQNILHAKIKLLYPFNFKLKEKDTKSSVIKFYSNRIINLEQYIKPGEKVISVGRALHSIIKSDALDIMGFYDTIFNKSYFYDPITKSYIYPIDSLSKWCFPRVRDDWERHFAHMQLKKAMIEIDTSYKFKRIKKIIVKDPNSWLIANTERAVKMACDIETKLLDPWNPESKILDVTISFDGVTGYLLAWEKIDVEIFSNFIKNKKLIMHNGKYDTKFFILKGVPRENIYIYHDTWSGSQLINEMQTNKLKSDAWLHTTHGGYDRELELYLEAHPKCKGDFSKIPIEVRYPYAIMDAIVTYQIYERQLELFDHIDTFLALENGWCNRKYFYEVRMLSVNTFLDVELNGMYVNWDLLEKYSNDTKAQLIGIKNKILNYFKLSNTDIKLTSGNELGTLFEINNWESHGRAKGKPTKKIVESLNKVYNKNFVSKEGYFLNGESQLQQWKKEKDKKEIVTTILKFRELNILLKTFIGDKDLNSGFFQYKRADGRIHSTFGPMLTNSHRNWSRDPNLQNIPKQGEKAEWYRRIFIPPNKDYYIVEMDAAGFQLRIGAIYSSDKAMHRVFTELGGDMHSMTGQSILKRDITLKKFLKLRSEKDPVIALIRQKSKTINFGLLFGMVARTFAQNVIEPNWSREEVYIYIKDNHLEEVQKSRYKIMLKSIISSNTESTHSHPRGNMFKDIPDKKYFSYCWAVASDVRNKFFKSYPMLLDWHKDTKKFANENGYVFSPFGAVRRLPQLTYQGADTDKGKVKNWHNVALNSPVQNFESVYMTILLGNQNSYTKINNLESMVCGNVHDSNVLYIHKDEVEKMTTLSRSIFEEDRPENKGIPQVLDVNIADYYEKKQSWGFGNKF